VRRLMPRAGSQTQFEQAAQNLRCYAVIEKKAMVNQLRCFERCPAQMRYAEFREKKSLLRYSRALQGTEVKRGGDVHAVIAPMSLRLPV
jgi:hypothetical protein